MVRRRDPARVGSTTAGFPSTDVEPREGSNRRRYGPGQRCGHDEEKATPPATITREGDGAMTMHLLICRVGHRGCCARRICRRCGLRLRRGGQTTTSPGDQTPSVPCYDVCRTMARRPSSSRRAPCAQVPRPLAAPGLVSARRRAVSTRALGAPPAASFLSSSPRAPFLHPRPLIHSRRNFAASSSAAFSTSG